MGGFQTATFRPEATTLPTAPQKAKGSKLHNHWKGKEWVAHLHKGNTAGKTELNKGLEKAGWKWKRKVGQPVRTGITASLIYNFIYVCICVCVKAMRFDISASIATKLNTLTKDFKEKVVKPISIS